MKKTKLIECVLCSLFRCYVVMLVENTVQCSEREREETENRGQWAPVSSILYPVHGLRLCSLYCVTQPGQGGLLRAQPRPGPGLGCPGQARLAIIHYWSIVHSLSTNGLARPGAAPYLRLRPPRTGDCDSGSRTWARSIVSG